MWVFLVGVLDAKFASCIFVILFAGLASFVLGAHLPLLKVASEGRAKPDPDSERRTQYTVIAKRRQAPGSPLFWGLGAHAGTPCYQLKCNEFG